MAEFRTIKMAFWSDPFIEELLPEEKLLYLYLFTSPYTNTLGICQVTLKKIAFETGLDIKTVTDTIYKFASCRKLVIDGNNILIVKFIKNQCSASDRLATFLKNEFQKIESVKIQDALCIIYPSLFAELHTVSEPEDTIWIPCQYPMHTLGGIKVQGTLVEGTLVQGKRVSADPSAEALSSENKIPDEYASFAEEYQKSIKEEQGELAPKVTKSLIKSAASEIEKAVRIDGFNFDEIKQALLWAKSNQFWQDKIRSLAQIRKVSGNGQTKLQNLVSQYRNRGKPTPIRNGTGYESRYEREQRERQESFAETMRILNMMDGTDSQEAQDGKDRSDYFDVSTF